MQAIEIGNPVLLGPLEQIQAVLPSLQSLRIDAQVAAGIAIIRLIPAFGLGNPDLSRLAIDLGILDLALAVEGEAAHAALGAEVPVDPVGEASVVAELRGVGGAEKLEIVGRVHGPDMEEAHLVACRAVALSEADSRTAGRRLGIDERGGQCKVDFYSIESFLFGDLG